MIIIRDLCPGLFGRGHSPLIAQTQIQKRPSFQPFFPIITNAVSLFFFLMGASASCGKTAMESVSSSAKYDTIKIWSSLDHACQKNKNKDGTAQVAYKIHPLQQVLGRHNNPPNQRDRMNSHSSFFAVLFLSRKQIRQAGVPPRRMSNFCLTDFIRFFLDGLVFHCRYCSRM